jgi:hypothetical protein
MHYNMLMPPETTDQQPEDGFYKSDEAAAGESETPIRDPSEPLASWTASEYIEHQKSFNWYTALFGATFIIAGLMYLITRDVVSAAVIVVVGILFGVFASRPPEVREYAIYPKGIRISDKLYEFDTFKSFALHDENSVPSIFLLPVQRFLPGLTVYFPPDQQDEIVNALSDYLPFEDREPDAIDNLMRKIRF